MDNNNENNPIIGIYHIYYLFNILIQIIKIQLQK